MINSELQLLSFFPGFLRVYEAVFQRLTFYAFIVP